MSFFKPPKDQKKSLALQLVTFNNFSHQGVLERRQMEWKCHTGGPTYYRAPLECSSDVPLSPQNTTSVEWQSTPSILAKLRDGRTHRALNQRRAFSHEVQGLGTSFMSSVQYNVYSVNPQQSLTLNKWRRTIKRGQLKASPSCCRGLFFPVGSNSWT